MRQEEMRDGKIYAWIRDRLSASILTDSFTEELLCLTNEMANTFPYRTPEVDGDPMQELLKLCRDRHFWFIKWFGVLLEGR